MATQITLQHYLTFTHWCTQSHMDGGVNHAGRQPARWEQLGWGAQGHLDTQQGGDGDQTSSQSTLPPETHDTPSTNNQECNNLSITCHPSGTGYSSHPHTKRTRPQPITWRRWTPGWLGPGGTCWWRVWDPWRKHRLWGRWVEPVAIKRMQVDFFYCSF